MFDVVEDTGSNLALNVSFIETLARASLKKTYLAGFPGTETERVGQRTAVYGTHAPKSPPFRRGESVTRIKQTNKSEKWERSLK